MMDDYFASTPLGNSTILCVGAITHAEAETAHSDGNQVSGFGYYLFVADESQPSSPIEILGTILSPTHAARLVTLFNTKSAVEPVAT